MDEKDRIPVNARELHTIEYLMALDAQLKRNENYIRDRLRAVPNGWRQYRLLESVADNLGIKICETVPTKTLCYLEKLSIFGEVKVQFRPASRLPDMIWATSDDMRTIANAAMASACAVCLRNEREVKQCKLRKAMSNVLIPEEIPKVGCPYRDIAEVSDLGDYV